LGSWGGKKYEGLGSQNVSIFGILGIYKFQKGAEYELLSKYF
jgi:hypothetical protein